MNLLILPLGLICGLVLAAAAVSVFMAYRAHRLLGDINGQERRSQTEKQDQLQDLRPLRESVDSLAAQVRELRSHPQAAAPAGVPRGGFNLNKRTQVLRMHRRGESAEQISASLELPRQEVELLLKVHSIVIQNV